MRYGYTITGIRIASDTYGEYANYPFTVNEFKTIWTVLKKHKINKKRAEGRDINHLNSGYPCFLVKEENLSNPLNDFWTYLYNEKFKSLNDYGIPQEWVLINVGNSTYLNSSDNPEILSYVRKNYENALTLTNLK